MVLREIANMRLASSANSLHFLLRVYVTTLVLACLNTTIYYVIRYLNHISYNEFSIQYL